MEDANNAVGGIGNQPTEKVRLSSRGYFGIGTSSPTEELHVQGNMRLTGAYYDRLNSAGTAGQILSSTATGTEWIPAPTGSGSDTDWTEDVNSVYNSTKNIGVGTNTPTNTLHVYGTTTVASSGGTIPIYEEDFSSSSITQENNGNMLCTNVNGWSIVTSSPYTCSSCVGSFASIDSDDGSSCEQNSKMKFEFSPATSSINVSFDYRYKDFSVTNDDYFKVYLWDVVNNTKLGGDLVASSGTDMDGSFAQNNITVSLSQQYILYFEYYGAYDYGATVDNVIITEQGQPIAGSYVMRLEDGTQGTGKVLTSDADGNAYWSSVSGVSNQTLSLSGNDLSISGGNSVTINPGTDSQILSLSGNDLTISGGNTITLPSSSTGSADTDWIEDASSVYNSVKKIGIGTSTPSTKLHVLGSQNFESTPSVTVENSLSDMDADATIHFKNNYSSALSNFTLGVNSSQGGAFEIRNTTGLQVGYNTGGSAIGPSLHIDPTTGFVGIGTNYPSSQLEVSGDLDVDGDGTFWGDLDVWGDFYVYTILGSTKNFLIDHPSFPKDKLLRHYSIESNEGLLIYRGKVNLDSSGKGEITLPDYFEDLVDESGTTVNLTPIGKVPFLVSYDFDENNKLMVYGKANSSVSYQVLAERDDPSFQLRRGNVIEEKNEKTIVPKGEYLDPEAYGLPPKKQQGKSKKIED